MSTTEQTEQAAKQFVPWNNLGKSGLKISNVIVGAMSFGSKEWAPWVLDDEEKIFKILKKAYDHGIRTFDTADIYSNGLSEIILGKFLKKYNIKRDKVVILTKVWGPIDEDLGPSFFFPFIKTDEERTNFANNQGLSRRHILDAAKNSVRRLGTYIDVYQVHRLDQNTPYEETLKALNDVVESGLARYIGASTMRAVDFVELQNIAERNGWHKFISVQSYYNLTNREDENELNYYAQKTGVGIIPFSPLAGGILAREIDSGSSELTTRQQSFGPISYVVKDDNPEQAVEIAIIKRVGELAAKKNVSRAAIATAWLIHKGANPIVGLNSEKRIDDLIIGANLKLDDDEVKYLEEPYKPRQRVFE
ncbi:putative aryl-alcohol dehydrogenase [Wickerhamomyces ciferrii]|uniref:Aryl-alcohol dehydrogenase n=1 Tax=Wickerhamomyces ciferrii (strain ATCC 14091 / BCRC 22168 / CBS 111 / JCM 3599 / NBRC 0793 / NRRL Y-1031 F-60-10) TaxID=1206466 RepID=K0KHR7_WICCF|nr:putative aryl-alcohol dehydrogenase [Wickerhamomyces ciferrii]CCH40703.1 putative aryl-alcohol dehydrogenase [Wickerhamomyces ciferrii]